MDWKELQESTKAIKEIAAQKINEMSDLASLHLKLKTSEYRLRVLYEELGKVAFCHFTTDESHVEKIKKFVEAIAAEQQTVTDLRATIKQAQEGQSQ